MPKLLELTRFGNPILRQVAQPVLITDIPSAEIQQVITDIRYTNKKKEYGMGLAAPQVGLDFALSVVGIKPSPTRPKLQVFESVIINPKYDGIGKRTGMWEGCQSCGSGDDILFAKSQRYSNIRAEWYDEYAQWHNEELSGFVAHVFQHETDHLKGILFIDKVKDKRTFMMADEYRKRIIKE